MVEEEEDRGAARGRRRRRHRCVADSPATGTKVVVDLERRPLVCARVKCEGWVSWVRVWSLKVCTGGGGDTCT